MSVMDGDLKVAVAAINLWSLIIALGIDAIIGWPDRLFRVAGHPVTWIGFLIGWLDRRLNRPDWRNSARRGAGVLALVITLIVVGGIAAGITVTLQDIQYGWVAEGILAASLIAQRSLYDHVVAVARAVEKDGLAGGREAVARIVGRDPDSLDEPSICRAAIESLAENFSDGVVAPVFWMAVAGLPGIALYKAINTADSMIGHRNDRYRAFGWAAARLDDLVNLPASRLTALLLICAAAAGRGMSAVAAFRSVERDAGQHRSPNAGWPEAAMAGALGLRLAGPRRYGARWIDDNWMGPPDGRSDATSTDIRRALRLYVMACGLMTAITLTGAIALQL